MLKISDEVHILLLMPHKVAQKCNFVHDFANNAGRLSKKYQASRGLSATAELLALLTCVYDFIKNVAHEKQLTRVYSYHLQLNNSDDYNI